MRKFLLCITLTFRFICTEGHIDAQAVTANGSFLRNLRQLRTNLIYLWQAANTPAGQLDVDTICAHLRTNLQQSAFTNTAGAHAANVLPTPATVPASPFTVDSTLNCHSGRFILSLAPNPVIIPVYNTVQTILNVQYPYINTPDEEDQLYNI
jgi:hypothetical protein